MGLSGEGLYAGGELTGGEIQYWLNSIRIKDC